MELEYTLIDCSTSLIYGPYETFDQARGQARREPGFSYGQATEPRTNPVACPFMLTGGDPT